MTTPLKDDLLPCPFCGEKAEVNQLGTPKRSCIVSCTMCGALLESNENGAGCFWNKRTPPDKWVSVDDRLPEKDEWLLVLADGAIATRAYTKKRGFVDWEVCAQPGLTMSEITHWQSLPEPPKETK